jgi:hypothetical protein
VEINTGNRRRLIITIAHVPPSCCLRRAAKVRAAVTVVPSLPPHFALVAPWLPDSQPPIVCTILPRPGVVCQVLFSTMFLIFLSYLKLILAL